MVRKFKPLLTFLNVIVDARLQWNNWFRGTLRKVCGRGEAIYFMKSQHSNHYEDRIFQLNCRQLNTGSLRKCHYTGYKNNYDKPLFASCPKNYILTGIIGKYSTSHRDRKFRLRCCRAPGHYTKSCKLSGFLNGFDKKVKYSTSGNRFFTGLYSYHDNGTE